MAIEIPSEFEYEVTDYVKEIDRARDSYHKFFTDEKLDTIKYRDMLIDSSTMSQDEIADCIIEAAKRKCKECQRCWISRFY